MYKKDREILIDLLKKVCLKACNIKVNLLECNKDIVDNHDVDIINDILDYTTKIIESLD